MLKHIKTFWEDVEEINNAGNIETSILNKYSSKLDNTTLFKHNDRTYIAGWDTNNVIVVIDYEEQKPFIRLSGNFAKL